MPWRLIAVIIIFGIFLAFITFNLGNKCDINFIVKKIPDVPVFLTAFSSFILGMLCAIPIVISASRKRKNRHDDEKPKKKWGKKDDVPELSPVDGGGFPGSGPYGIN